MSDHTRSDAARLEPVTVLATSVGNDGFPSVLQALKDAPDRDVVVVGVDARREAAGLALSDVGAVVPLRSEPEALLTALQSLCRVHQVDVLLPLSTEDQEFFAAHRKPFLDSGIRVGAPEIYACLAPRCVGS